MPGQSTATLSGGGGRNTLGQSTATLSGGGGGDTLGPSTATVSGGGDTLGLSTATVSGVQNFSFTTDHMYGTKAQKRNTTVTPE